MVSRRTFITAGSAAVVASACKAPDAAPAATATGDNTAAKSSTMPPAIAALTSMKSQATPISVDERKARIEKARQLMVANSIDALMLAGRLVLVFRNVRQCRRRIRDLRSGRP